jgi:hypothetical protein
MEALGVIDTVLGLAFLRAVVRRRRRVRVNVVLLAVTLVARGRRRGRRRRRAVGRTRRQALSTGRARRGIEALRMVDAMLRLALLRTVVRRRRRVGMLLAVVSPRAVQLVGRALDDLNLDDWVAPLVAVLGRRMRKRARVIRCARMRRRRRDRVNIMLLAVTLMARGRRWRRDRMNVMLVAVILMARRRRKRVRRFTASAEVEALGAFNRLRSRGNLGRHGGSQDELDEQVRTHCCRLLLSLPVGRRGVCRIPFLLGFCCFFYLNDYLKLR